MKSMIAVLLLALAPLAAQATDIYRWTDETGRVNYGNVVPDQFKRVATKIDTSRSQVVVSNPQQTTPSASTGSSAQGTRQPEITGPHGVGY